MQKEPTYHDLLERMQIVIEHSNELFYLHDTNYILSYVSPTSKKILGYTPEEMMLNWTHLATDNPINQKGIEITKLAIQTGQRQPPYLVEIRKKDGSNALLEIDESPIKDKAGKVVAIVGASRDVTEKKHAEEALRAERDKARLYLDISNFIFIAIDKKGSVKLVNKKGCHVLGAAKEELIGKNWFDHCLPERLRKDTRAVFNQIMTGEIAPFEYFENPILTADGKERTIAWHNTLIHDKNGSIIGTLSSGEDVTEQKLAEKALQESEERFRNMAELLPEIIYEIDIQGNLTFVNQFAFTQFQYTEAEFINGLNALEMIVPEDRERGMTNIMKILDGEHVGLKEYRALRKDGSSFPALFHSAAIIRDGKPVGLRGVIVDVTERRQAEEENKILERKLMQAQKMEALGTLSGGIAHDFNNLMTGIIGNTSLMLFGLDANHVHYERLKQIEKLVKRGASLTRQLLGLSKQGKFEVLPTNLNNLICESVEIYGRTRKDIQIHTKLQEDIWTVVVDRGQIEQVLLNLFINAWQAMPQGGNLYVETRNCLLDKAEARAHDLPAGQYAKITVADTGIGMDKATRQKVFDPFFTTKEMERGTGLGLASAYGIVQNHEGVINVNSTPGKGTTFTFYLPASEKESMEQKDSAPDIILGKGTILLVEDEIMVAETAKEMLEKLGYNVTTAASGKEALSSYAGQPDRFDMVILDMVMPSMGGTRTFEQLKQIDANVKVLLSSGYSINEQVRNLLSLGCKGFIQKPFTVHELSQKVGRVLA